MGTGSFPKTREFPLQSQGSRQTRNLQALLPPARIIKKFFLGKPWPSRGCHQAAEPGKTQKGVASEKATPSLAEDLVLPPNPSLLPTNQTTFSKSLKSNNKILYGI